MRGLHSKDAEVELLQSWIPVLGGIGGMTILFSLLYDIIKLGTFHISMLYAVLVKLHNVQFRLLSRYGNIT